MIMNNKNILIFSILATLVLGACEDLAERGDRPEYKLSSVNFTAEPKSLDNRSAGDSITYIITAQGEQDMRSLLILPKTTGGSKTRINYTGEDPFRDHRFGLMQDGVKQFGLEYIYYIPETSSDIKITFTLIDGEGEKEVEHKIEVEPDINTFRNINLYTESGINTDGFSTIDGKAYTNLVQYEKFSEENVNIQESVDIIFLVDRESYGAMLVAPGNSEFQSGFNSKNNTVFAKSSLITNENFDKLTNGTLADLTIADSLSTKGKNAIKNIRVGDVISFQTDYNAKNNYKKGAIRINAIHPASCEWYSGEVYAVEMDVITQLTKE